MSSTRRVAVVTGANKGIGFGIVKALCSKFDGDVILTARDKGRGEEAIQKLKNLGLEPKFHLLAIDSLESVFTFRDFLQNTYGGLDVLINNAAIAYRIAATEPFGEQAENTIGVNFTASMKLCHALFPLLRPQARVVNISSLVGHLSMVPGKKLRDKLGHPDITESTIVDLMDSFIEAAKAGKHVAQGWPNSTYTVSKVGLSALTRFQQRIMDTTRPDDGILVNSVNPGFVDTDMTTHKGILTIDEGAIAPVWAALIPPGVKSPAGGYIWNNTQVVDWVNGPLP